MSFVSTNFQITIENLIKSIDMYKSLIIITDDTNLNLIYIDCLLKLEDKLKFIYKYLNENKQKHLK